MPLPTDLPTDKVAGQLGHDTGHNATNTRVNAIATEVNGIELSIDPTVVVAAAAQFTGLDPTGVADSAAALQAAIDATPTLGTLIIPPGTYLCSSGLTNGGRSITIDGRGATLVKNTSSTLLAMSGAYATAVTVTTIAAATITNDDASTTAGTLLTLASSPAWTRGQIVKLVADDVIPGARPGAGAPQPRVGEYLVVESSSGTAVTCAGTLRDTFTTAVRVSALNPVTVNLRGLRLAKNAALSGSVTSGMVSMTAMVTPTISDVTVLDTPGAAINFSGCYGYEARNVSVENATDAPSGSHYGYGIVDNSCMFGRVTGLRARRVRHAYTDDTVEVATGSSVTLFGRTYGTIIADSFCHGSSNTAWDTHHASQSVTFANCVAVDCLTGFGLRGRKHAVSKGRVVNCQYGLRIFAETAGGESWGHSVNGLRVAGVNTNAVVLDLNPVGHPNAGVQETRYSTIRSVLIDDVSAKAVHASNAKVQLFDVCVTVAATSVNSTHLIYGVNAAIEGGGFILDYRGNTAGTSLRVFELGTGASIDARDITVRSNSDFGTRVLYFVLIASGVLVQLDNCLLDWKPVTISPSLTTGSRLDYAIRSLSTAAGENSAYTVGTGVQISDGTAADVLSRSAERVLVGRLNPNVGAATLSALKNGLRNGQQLILWNANATNNVTVQNGATPKTTLRTGADTVLTPGLTMTLFWNGSTWQQT